MLQIRAKRDGINCKTKQNVLVESYADSIKLHKIDLGSSFVHRLEKRMALVTFLSMQCNMHNKSWIVIELI